jgi:outer membrane cobalamin receptor
MKRIFLSVVALLLAFQHLSAQDMPDTRRKGKIRQPKPQVAPAEKPRKEKSAQPVISRPNAQTIATNEAIDANVGFVEGYIYDGETGEPLDNATVLVVGTQLGAITDFEGHYRIKNVPVGNQKLVVKYLGYLDQTLEVSVQGGRALDIGKTQLVTNAIGLDEIEVVAQVAVNRQTPVAVSTVDVKWRDERYGSQEFPELLKFTPGVYASKSGGGFGDSRIALRGFGQENIAVLINGIPVNDMENGRVFWSNWAGLSDVIRTLQVQRGLGASKIAINSVGGTINLLTKTTDIEKGGSLSFEASNYYSYKTILSASTGRSENGWAVSFVGSRTVGQGYITQTPMDAWSYFLSISKELGSRHILSFTALGAPQEHGQRLNMQPIATYDRYGGDVRYNADWGYLNGRAIQTNRNFYHKPLFALNHYFNISEKTNLGTSVYFSMGRGGGSGNFLSSGTRFTARDGYGQWDYNAAQAINRAKLDTVKLGDGRTQIGYGSDVIIASSINSHNWYGALSTLNHKFNDRFKLLAGLDLRYYEGYHWRTADDLLGGDFFVDPNNKNVGNQIIRKGGKFDYDYDSYIGWYGGFGQLEYNTRLFSAFVSGTISQTHMKRKDFFVKPDPAKNIKQESPWYDFLGFNIKGGANYRISERFNVFANAGYFTRAPYFNSMFVDRRRTNEVVSNLKNEKIMSFEAGLGGRFKRFTFDVNVYYTDWSDKLFVIPYVEPVTNISKAANASGLGARHYGIELEGVAKPMKWLQVTYMASVGDWRWKNDVTARIIDDFGREVKTTKLLIKDLYVGNSAQTTSALGLRFQITPQIYFIADYTYFARIYANFDPERRVAQEGKPEDRKQSWQMPDYGIVDLHLGYDFKIAGMDATLKGDVFNLFNKKYVLEAQDGTNHDAASAQVFYGFGTYFNLGMQIKF